MTLIIAMTLAATMASVDASKLTFSAPPTIVELDMGKLKGDLMRLAWSPDGKQLYVLTVERDASGNPKSMRHYVMGLDGKNPKGVNAEPPWVAAYWTWKSAQTAPALPAFRIEVEQGQKRITSTSIPRGGALARGGVSGSGGTSVDEGMEAGLGFHTAYVYTLRLKGEVVGEFINEPAVPGLTFGWGPAGSGLMAFTDKDGHLIVMDDQGHKQEIKDTKDAQLPAWTDDGKRLAYAQKTGRKTFAVRVLDVTGGMP